MVKIELSLHATKLKNVAGAFRGTSDPFAVVTQIATKPGDSPSVVGRTETVQNTTSPEWNRVFLLDYAMGTPTKIAVTLFDEVRKGDNRGMGAAVFEIGELLGARGNTKARQVKGGGTLYATARQSQGSGILGVQLRAANLKNTEGLLRKSDPFFELLRKVDCAGGQTWDNVFRSDVVEDNLSPTWKEGRIELSVLCGGNLDLPLRVKVFDYEGSGRHVLMGELETSVNGLVKAASSGSTMTLQKSGKDTGSITIAKAEVIGIATPGSTPVNERMGNLSLSTTSPPTFLDYLAGGCQLNVTIAIDFTGSNGDPRKPGTLHYLHPDGSHNDYEKAMIAIVGILEKYDSDKKFPVLGYGAKYDGEVKHCFQCGSSEEVMGAAGVLQAYREVFRSGLIMSRPTVITDVIQTAAGRADRSLQSALARGEQTYTILLIMTDGVVADVAATVACLEAVEDKPLSVVIVGVGSEDFTGMRQLDGDLKARDGKRDIVQFVEFNKHNSSPVDLSSHTLEEIPRQVVDFFQRRKIQPGSVVQTEEKDIFVDDEEEIDLSLDVQEDEIVISGGGSDFSRW